MDGVLGIDCYRNYDSTLEPMKLLWQYRALYPAMPHLGVVSDSFHCFGWMVDSLFLFQSAPKIKNSYLLSLLLIIPN